MKRYRWLFFAGALVCTGLVIRYVAPGMGLSTASSAQSYVTPETWKEAGARLEPYLVQARFAKIPDRLAVLVFKDRKQMEVWGGDAGSWRFIRSYPVLAASGISGPKLRENDRQVPEGVYRVGLLNPRSSFYLAIKLDYPNAYDRQKAAADGRTNLGGPACIHGWEVNSGSLAIGNVAIEELYLLASKVGAENVRVLIAPNDLRTERPLQQGGPDVPWLNELYTKLAKELQPFRHATLSAQAR